MKYIQLFSLELIHGFYADSRCSDFEIEPTPETQKLLGNFRCVLKPFPNGVRILTVAGDHRSPLIPLPNEVTFSFYLRLRNPNFALFTDFTEIAPIAAPLYTNSQPGPELKLVSRVTDATEAFYVRQPAQLEAFVLSGRPLNGIQAAAFRLEGLGGTSTPESYDEIAKMIRVNSQAAKAGAAFTATYPTEPQLKRDVFADVEIQYANTMAGVGGTTKFQVVFKPKTARWKYYIITNKADNSSKIPTIEDKDKAVIFDTVDRTDLTNSPDLTDKIAVALAEQYPDMHIFRLVSNALIPCQKTARRAIQLQINGDMVIGALPNPALENYVVELRDSKQEDGLYHVIKTINQ